MGAFPGGADDGLTKVSQESQRVSAYAGWPESRERRELEASIVVLRPIIGLAVVVAVVFFVVAASKFDTEKTASTSTWLGCVVPGAIAGLLSLTLLNRYTVRRNRFFDRIDREQQEAAERERAKTLGTTTHDSVLGRLLEANRDVLRAYQEPVRRQAESSYLFAQIALAIGLCVLIAGILLALLVNDDTSKTVAAGLTAIGGALSGYIGRTYLRVYDRAQQQLNYYFEEPLITSYFLNAERVAERLDGVEQDNALKTIVEAVSRTAGTLRNTPNQGDPAQERQSVFKRGKAAGGA